MAFDFSKISGESFGDINKVFFEKNGKSILSPEKNDQTNTRVSVNDITEGIANTAKIAAKNKGEIDMYFLTQTTAS